MSYCKFHPLIKAQYRCSECDITCCTECSDEQTNQFDTKQGNNCFICGFSLEQINNESNVVPFWRSLNSIYRYPTSVSALLVIFISALLISILPSMWFVWLFASIAVIHYCFACLRHTAHGNMDAPEFNESFEGSIAPIFYVYLAIIILGFVAQILAKIFGLWVGGIALVAFVIALPAVILLIAIEEKLWPALNPGKLIGIVSTSGTSYFMMMLFILIMSSSVGLLSALFASDSFSASRLFIQTAISNYYSIVIFHIMGYLVHQNGSRLGFSDTNNTIEESGRPDEKRLNAKIEVLIKSGAYKEALELCVKQVKSNDSNLWHWNRCFKLMLTREPDKQFEGFMKAYFKQLDERDQLETMAETYISIKRRQSTFELNEPDLQLKIADELIQIGQYKYAVVLLRKFHTVTQVKELLAKSFNLLSQAYEKIPGGNKNALLFKQQHERITSSL